jgi:Dyp-type peroxidase family
VRLTDQDLDDIQGVITSGYGHLPLSAYLFVTMTDPAGARRWLARASESITSSRRWPEGAKPRVAVNIALTASGLRDSGLPARVVCTFPPEFQDGIASPERSRILGDSGESAPEFWELGGPGTAPVHAMLLLFAADAPTLEELCSTQRTLLESADGVAELPGTMQRGYRPATASEPFGFHDGIAQPRIAGLADEGVPTGEFILGYENHYGVIPPTPVVPRELDSGGILPRLSNPFHGGDLCDLGRNGSYLVYRKLQQDVAGFWQFMTREAARGGSTDPEHIVWLAAKCVGRWPSGAPLALAPERDDVNLADRDDFYYANDPQGLRCPIGAHVRRTNPRDALRPYPRQQSLNMTDAHRLIRRGRVYGPPLFEADVLSRASSPETRKTLQHMRDDGLARGVHFFCVNASVKSQFEFVQQTWCNNPRFGGLNDNMDPLTSTPCGDDAPSRMTIPRAQGAWRTSALPHFVTVKAGAYLFLPSLTALRFLASAAAREQRPRDGRS